MSAKRKDLTHLKEENECTAEKSVIILVEHLDGDLFMQLKKGDENGSY